MTKHTCPKCNSTFEASADGSGTALECPNCGQQIQTQDDPIGSHHIISTLPPDDDVANDSTFKVNAESDDNLDSFKNRMFNNGEEDGGVKKIIKDTFDEFRNFDYSLLKPMLMVFSPQIIKQKAVQWVVGFGLFPLFVLYLSIHFELSFQKASWFLGAYFCVFWIVFFNSMFAPSQEIKKQGIKWALFTILVGLPILLFWKQMPIISDIYSGTESHSFIWRMLAYILGVGVCEELCKALPLLLFGRNKPDLLTPRNAIYFGIMSGLGLALAEVVEYTYTYWSNSAVMSVDVFTKVMENSMTWGGSIDPNRFIHILRELAMPYLVQEYGNMVTVQIVRFMSLPLLHAAWAGIAGYFIGLSLLKKRGQWVYIVIGIATVAILHGLYDVFSGSVYGFGLAAISILILMSYLSEEKKITQSVKQSVRQSHVE